MIGEKLLFWLEVLGVCKFIREADQALTYAERWFQVRSFIVVMNGQHVNENLIGTNGV